MLFYIPLPSRPKIHTLCSRADRERFSVFRADHWVQKSGHLLVRKYKHFIKFMSLDVVSSSFIASKYKEIREKQLGGGGRKIKRLWRNPNPVTMTVFAWRDRRQSRRTLGVRGKIRRRRLSNSSQMHSRLSRIFSNGATAPSGAGPPHNRGFTITLRHTTLGRTPLDEWSAWRRGLYLTTYNTYNRRTSMPPAGFEPTIPASERPHNHAYGKATLELEPTQHSKPTFVWTHIYRHLWLLLIRHVRPDFCLQKDFFCQSAYCRWCERYMMYASDDYGEEFLLMDSNLCGKFTTSRRRWINQLWESRIDGEYFKLCKILTEIPVKFR
jgi:hypothetical protein